MHPTTQAAEPRRHPAELGVRSTLVGMAFNLLLAVIKTFAGVIGNTWALVADGIESLSDVFSSFVVFMGLRIAMRPADDDHPYGHGKAEPIAAVIVAVALLVAAAAIVYESIRAIRTPHASPAAWTLWVLAGVVLAKEMLFRYVNQVGAEVSSTAVKTDAWHHRSDAVTSAMAFVGISAALLAGPGWEAADDWAALLAAGVIAFNALRLMKPAVFELTDVAPDTAMLDEVRTVASRIPGVIDVEKCFARKMGFDYYVDIHIIVDPHITVSAGHDIAHEVKDAIRAANPRVAEALVHVEPEGWH